MTEDREVAFLTGPGGARLAEFNLYKFIFPDKSEEEINKELDKRDYPPGLYKVSSGIDEPYLQYLGDPRDEGAKG